MIVWDTETTGRINFGVPSADPSHPHLCSIAWIRCDAAGVPLPEAGRKYRLVRPDGWTVPADAVAIHGLTTERLSDEGIALQQVAEEFFADVATDQRAGGYRVAYNHGFDNRMIRIEQHRLGHEDAKLIWWQQGSPSRCAMAPMQRLVKAPPTKAMVAARRYHYKTPNLTESYRYLFGTDFAGAHGAEADAEAARAIWAELLARRHVS